MSDRLCRCGHAWTLHHPTGGTDLAGCEANPCDCEDYVMSDPAVEAAQRAGMRQFPPKSRGLAIDAAREALAPLRDQMAAIKRRYSEVEDRMLAADTSAEMSRHANEMAGMRYAYDALAPLIYPEEELVTGDE